MNPSKESLNEVFQLLSYYATNQYDINAENKADKEGYWSFVSLKIRIDSRTKIAKLLTELIGENEIYGLEYDQYNKWYSLRFKNIPFLDIDNGLRLKIYEDVSKKLITLTSLNVSTYFKLD